MPAPKIPTDLGLTAACITDEALTRQISMGYRTFDALCTAFRINKRNGDYRILDRALQHLRREGRLAWDRKNGWRVVKA
jgi:hypothetical protein